VFHLDSNGNLQNDFFPNGSEDEHYRKGFNESFAPALVATVAVPAILTSDSFTGGAIFGLVADYLEQYANNVCSGKPLREVYNVKRSVVVSVSSAVFSHYLSKAIPVIAKWIPDWIVNAAKTETQLFRHYGYAEDAAMFEAGLNPGGYATHARGRPMGGATAQERLALPHETPPDAYYRIRIGPDTPVQGPSPVRRTEIPPRTGGGIQYYFPEGTPSGSVEGPFPIR